LVLVSWSGRVGEGLVGGKEWARTFGSAESPFVLYDAAKGRKVRKRQPNSMKVIEIGEIQILRHEIFVNWIVSLYSHLIESAKNKTRQDFEASNYNEVFQEKSHTL
jgi:hypothetical protein